MKAYVNIYRTKPNGFLVPGSVFLSRESAEKFCDTDMVQTVEFEVVEDAVDIPSEVKEIA